MREIARAGARPGMRFSAHMYTNLMQALRRWLALGSVTAQLLACVSADRAALCCDCIPTVLGPLFKIRHSAGEPTATGGAAEADVKNSETESRQARHAGSVLIVVR